MPSRCCGCRSRSSTPSPYRCLYRTISCFVLLLILGLAGFIMGMVNYFVPPTEHLVSASPLDTRILIFDQPECGKLSVVADSSDPLHVDLYLLSQKPHTDLGVVIHENVRFPLYSADFRQSYSYYLVKGSSMQISVKVSDLSSYEDDEVDVKIHVQLNGGVSQTYSCYLTYLDPSCKHPVTAAADGQYDISLNFKKSRMAFFTVETSIVISKYIYVVDKTHTHCSAPCTRDIKGYNEYALVTTSNVTGGVSWGDTVDYTWMCSNIRSVGMWVNLLMLLGMLFMMVSVGFIVGLSVVLCIKKRTESEETDPLIPQFSEPPIPNLVEPPPQYTVASENPLLSLANPPPYTESVDPQQQNGEGAAK